MKELNIGRVFSMVEEVLGIGSQEEAPGERS
jgi:hypothetical protein